MSWLKAIWYFLVPPETEVRLRRLELAVWAFVLSLSFYPESFGFLAWFGLIRPLVILTRLEGRAAFKSAYFFGFCFNLFTVYWIAMVTAPGMIASVVYLAFYYAIVLWMFVKVYRFRKIWGLVALPFLWVGMEYSRTISEFAFPWSDMGYSQSYYLLILQIVSVISVHGLSFLIVAVNVLLRQVFRQSLSPERRITSFLASAGIVVAILSYGWIVTPPHPVPGEFKVALMQGSVPLEVKWAQDNQEHSLKLYDSLATSVIDSSAKLYIWPETAAPCYPSHQPYCRDALGATARKTGAHHIIGGMAASGTRDVPRYHNACYQYDQLGQIVKRHDKVMLVPFAEHVPYQDYVPFLHEQFIRKYLTFIDTWNIQWWSDYYPGDGATLFETEDATYSVLICFETAFPEYVRQMILSGSRFIVGITNDTWFGSSVGIHMHSRMFITRAVENRCWAARSANSGLTYIVDNYGRIRSELELYEVGVLVSEVGLREGQSIYTKYGDFVGLLSLLITLSIGGIFLVLWLLRKLKLSK